ncbi:MAG: SCO family protein [Verrucomicrobiota bacterium]
MFRKLLFTLTLLGTAYLPAATITTTVQSSDPEARTLTLIDGETVKVSPGDARIGYTGRTIAGTMENTPDGANLHTITPANPVDLKVMAGINKNLHRDTVQRGRKAYRAIGEYLPELAMWDQEGRLVTRDSFMGKPHVVSFIFTRCKVAKMCPATTAKMVSLQREAKAAGLDAELVLITFDPEYDTPGVLNEYGKQRGADFESFSFLTGDPQATENLMKQFGILTIDEDDTINHTTSTILLDDKGKFLYRKDGSGWTWEEFLERLKELNAKS